MFAIEYLKPPFYEKNPAYFVADFSSICRFGPYDTTLQSWCNKTWLSYIIAITG